MVIWKKQTSYQTQARLRWGLSFIRDNFIEQFYGGTVLTFKIHNIGTVPMFKIHNVGTVPTSKVNKIGTFPTFVMHSIGTLRFFFVAKNR